VATPRDIPEEVLRRYSHLGRGLHLAAHQGGFSGARIWRVDSSIGAFCLKSWPMAAMTGQRLSWIHELMRQARSKNLAFVPTVYPLVDGTTLLEYDHWLWDLTDWMPGKADFQLNPLPARLGAACEALAQLHLAWTPPVDRYDFCPAIERRLEAGFILSDWIRSNWQPSAQAVGQSVVKRAWDALRSKGEWMEPLLEPLRTRKWLMQPCLCDIWHDHVFFAGNKVSAIIDFGAAKINHVAVDLARLLGSLVEDDLASSSLGLDAYGSIRPISGLERRLARVLDVTGTLAGLVTWLHWLGREHQQFANESIVSDRIARLTGRVQGWKTWSDAVGD
jgi:homoserine kinase type II